MLYSLKDALEIGVVETNETVEDRYLEAFDVFKDSLAKVITFLADSVH